MIQLKPIPNVTGLPDGDQKSITYIRNGEMLEGSTTKYGYDGNLNSPSVQIQENVVVLDENIKLLAENADSANTSIQQLENFINQSGNTDLIETVAEHGTKINALETSQVSNVQKLDEHETEITGLQTDVGLKTSFQGTRNIFEDLFFIKSRIGNEPDQTINGDSSIGLESTGLIKKLSDVTKQVLLNKTTIETITTDLNGISVTDLSNDVLQLRFEIGDSTNATADSIYLRLKNLEQYKNTSTMSLDNIEASIGGRNVSRDLTLIENRQNEFDLQFTNPTDGVYTRLNNLETSSTNYETRLNVLELFKTDSTTAQTQMAADIVELNTFVGNETVPAPTSLLSKLNELIAIQNDTSATVQDIQAELGNASTGIIGDIVQLKQRMTALEARVTALETP